MPLRPLFCLFLSDRFRQVLLYKSGNVFGHFRAERGTEAQFVECQTPDQEGGGHSLSKWVGVPIDQNSPKFALFILHSVNLRPEFFY